MGFKFPPRGCRGKILGFFDGLYLRVTALFPILAAPPCYEIRLDDSEYQGAEFAID